MFGLESEADVYPEDSSSDDEDLWTRLNNCSSSDSDSDYIPRIPIEWSHSSDSVADDDESTFLEPAGPSTSAHHGSAPTSLHSPLQTHGDDHDDDTQESASAPLSVTPVTSCSASAPASVPPPQQQPATATRTSQIKRQRASAPPPFSESETQPKKKAKHGRRGSNSTASVKEVEEEERWHNKEEMDPRPNRVKFMPARTPGPTFDTTASWSPLSLFRLFFSDSTVRTIINNTNANAAKRLQAGLKFRWTPLTQSDFWIFMSIILFTGLVSVHQRSDYWRKEWPYGFPFPRNRMTRERFEAILYSLHLSNPIEDEENDRKRNTAEYDRLFKIKPLYTEIVSACQAHFQPYQNICIDERMVATKARISMKQYMKGKPTKWGYKIFVLADAQTAYTFNFFVYQGKNDSTTAHNLTFSSVWDLLPFETLGRGYNLYVDNYYTSPALFEELYKKNIRCCGTIRTNRAGYPKTEVNNLSKKAERGDMRWIRRGKLLFVKWKDTREVNMCSTVHEAFTGQTVTRRVKKDGVWSIKTVPVPSAVVDYNRFMGGVDLSDALIKYYSVHHKTTEWYKTFFYHFIDVAVVNSFLLHKELCKTRKWKPRTQKIFRESLAKEMLDFGAGSAPPQPPPVTCMPMFFGPQDIDGDDKRKYCQRCHDAGQRRVKTRVYCRKCHVPLCFVKDKNCFVKWHDVRR